MVEGEDEERSGVGLLMLNRWWLGVGFERIFVSIVNAGDWLFPVPRSPDTAFLSVPQN